MEENKRSLGSNSSLNRPRRRKTKLPIRRVPSTPSYPLSLPLLLITSTAHYTPFLSSIPLLPFPSSFPSHVLTPATSSTPLAPSPKLKNSNPTHQTPPHHQNPPCSNSFLQEIYPLDVYLCIENWIRRWLHF